jgi:hypothetical protein
MVHLEGVVSNVWFGEKSHRLRNPGPYIIVSCKTGWSVFWKFSNPKSTSTPIIQKIPWAAVHHANLAQVAMHRK